MPNIKDNVDQLRIKNIKPNTAIGQHFLIDQEIVNRLIGATDITKDDIVIEVGAGTGIVTEKLIPTAKRIYAYEIDQQFAPYLNELKSKVNNLIIVWENIRQAELPAKYTKVVGNIPYHISESMLWKFRNENFKTMVLITGKDFAVKLTAKIDDKNFCNLSVIFQAQFNIELIEIIEKGHFYPCPPVASALIKITPVTKEELLKNIPHFILNFIWNVKEMKLKNALREALISYVRQKKNQQLTKKQAKKIVDAFGLPKEELNKIVDGGNSVLVAETLRGFYFEGLEE